MKAQIIRLPIRMTLFNSNDEIVQKYSGTKKSQAIAKLLNVSRTEWNYGVCRVWYNKQEDYWNEFRFTEPSQLKENLTIDTEWAMIEAFYKDGTLDKCYLGKKKVVLSEKKKQELRTHMKAMRAKLMKGVNK